MKELQEEESVETKKYQNHISSLGNHPERKMPPNPVPIDQTLLLKDGENFQIEQIQKPCEESVNTKVMPTKKPPLTNPTFGDQPKISVKKEAAAPVKAKPQSFYYCPISGCKFFTTKAGMKTSEAALHLKNEHKLKAKDMKPG